MNVLNVLRKTKKKAVSPVVAAILLIGLVVVAGAAIAFIVLPMLSSTPAIDKVKPSVSKNVTYVTASNKTTFEIAIKNENTGKVNLIGFALKNGTASITTAVKPTVPISITGGLTEFVTFEFDGDYSAATSVVLSFTDSTDGALGDITVNL
ncbi:MAG: archaellin/type IV pilin N-terminal domain-containing protein [Candidatus Odinarchaeota archaeon]